MTTFKSVLATTAVIATFSLSSAHANGFFTVGTKHMPPTQPVSFNSDAHTGTTFWDYYNNGHTTTVDKSKKMISFDDSNLGNPYLAPLYN